VDIQEVNSRREFAASEYWGAIDELESEKLARLALKYYIPLDGLEWGRDQFGNKYLAGDRSKLYRAIRDEQHGIWEFRLKIIGALTGLIGTAIGLIAILKS